MHFNKNHFPAKNFILLISGILYGQVCQTSQAPPASMPTSTDAAYIKAYLHVIRNNTGGGGATQAQIEDVIAELEGPQFKNHNIHFSVACISEIENSSLLEDGCLISAHYGTYSLPDGLNIYLTTSSCTTPQGTVFGSALNPGNSCWANIDLGVEFTVSHEVGHNLGLFHTFLGNECADGSNCSTDGDMICDTPADPFNISYCITGSCNWDNMCSFDNRTPPQCGSSAYYEFDPTIIMSYYHGCYNRFTDGQAEVMRGTVNTGSLSNVNAGEFYIDYDAVWTSPKQFNVDVIVKSPNKLTISTLVEMGPGRKIIIEPGAFLTIDGGHVTIGTGTGCPGSDADFWGGIEVEGADSYVHIINGSKIESAEKGVFYGDPMNAVETSLVRVRDSEFLNNLKAIDMVSAKPAPYINFLSSNSTFKVDNTFEGQITQQLVFGKAVALFSNSKVLNESNELESSDVGISSYDTRLFNIGGEIKGFYNGAQFRTLFSNTPFFFRGGCTLEEAFTHISAYAIDNFIIKDCTFKIGHPQLTNVHGPTGLLNWYGDGFNVLSNIFMDSHNSFGDAGTRTNYGGPDYSLVQDNKYSNLGFANETNGANRFLTYLCNQNTNNNVDMHIGSGMINVDHGTEFDPAGNKFGNQADIRNFGQELNYHYSTTNLTEFPDNTSGMVNLFPTAEESCTNGFKDPGGETLQEKELSYQTDSTLLIGKEDSLSAKIDAGNTVGLLAQINSSTSGSTLFALLQSISPYLSKDALLAAYKRNDILPDNERISLLSANPDVLFWKAFQDQLYNYTEPLDSLTLDSLIANLSPNTTRTTEERAIRNLKAGITAIVNSAVMLEYSDTSTVLDYTLISKWINRLGDFNSSLQIAGLLLEQGDTTGFSNDITNIPSALSLDSLEELEYAQLIKLKEILLTAYANGRYEGLLTQPERDSLELIALEGRGRTSQYAKNILEFFYNYNFGGQSLIASNNGGSAQALEDFSSHGIDADLIVYPNPVKNVVNITTTKGLIQQVFVYSLTGQLIQSYKFLSDSNAQLDLQGCPVGTYILQIHLDQGIVNRKIIIQP